MKIRILAVGKLKKNPILDQIKDFLKRSKWSVQIIEIEHSSKEAECVQLLSYLNSEDYLVAMDEKGQSMTSLDFSKFMEKLQVGGGSRINFVIGGAYGLAAQLLERANYKLAFGIQTWPHMFVRLMLVEQIYRAESILAGHPYHKQ